jgi:hypothetical protein
MIDTIKTSWYIGLFSYRFLLRTPVILILPILSTFCFGVCVTLLYRLSNNEVINIITLTIITYYVFLFFYLFFSVVAIEMTYSYLQNSQNPSLGRGLKLTLLKIFTIIIWTVINGTIGLIINITNNLLDNNTDSSILGWIFSIFLNIAWGIVTCFLMPMIIFDPAKNRLSVIKKSVSFFEKEDQQLKNFPKIIGAGVFNVMLAIPIIILFVITVKFSLAPFSRILYFICGISYILFLYFSSIAHYVLLTILYIFALDKSSLSNLDINEELIKKSLVTF